MCLSFYIDQVYECFDYLCLFFVTLSACFSLSRPPPKIFCSSQSLFFVGFLKISLKMVYLTIGIDGKRYKKIEIDAKRWESTAAVLENAGVHVMLQTRTCGP